MEVVIELTLVDKLGMLGVNRFDFDCNFKVSLSVDCLVDLSEGSFVDLLDDLEVFANFL